MHEDSGVKSRNYKNDENDDSDLKILDIFSLKNDTKDKENPNIARKITTKNHLKIKPFTTIIQPFQEKVLLKFRKKDNGQFISQQMVEGVNVPGVKQPVQMDR